MQFIDLAAQQARIQPDLDARIARVFEHRHFIMGPEVAKLEARLAAFVDVEHCVTVSSGTDALQLALMALDIGPGDEVVTTPFTFVATAETIRLVGATPVFVDIDPATYNLDPNAIEARVSDRTRAILPVGLFGQTPAMSAINAVAEHYAVPVIEDAAQSFGAWHAGQRSCGLSTLGVTSFFPAKPLGCYGDGGAVFTRDPALAERLCCLRNHGQNRSYYYDCVGTNARLDTIQAAVLLSKLTVFEDEIAERQQVAARYDQLLADTVQVPVIADDGASVFSQYTVSVTERDQVAAALNDAAIPTAVYYPLPLNRQPPYLDSTPTPNADRAAERVLSLPMHPYLAAADQNRVCEALRTALSQSAA